ncbi:MAG: galactose-1-phosphate uridylyltransferase [Chloroflexi bacterium]|nr:galactose-1-phosphate uridylyltransferase [Chloroflexota bacterium]
MSELRQDKTTREWVIIARERGKRPHDFISHLEKPCPTSTYISSCPFCPGQEELTPGEVLAYRDESDGDQKKWKVRVVPNKFPALSPGGSAARVYEDSFFLKADGVGAHEVIIETPIHNKVMALMTAEEVTEIWRAYWERYRALEKLEDIKLIIIFRNQGASAGTSLEHPHTQLVATPVWPSQVRRQFEVAMDHYDETGRCLYTDIMEFERKAEKRMITETDRFVVFHPFASRVPFETWIMPKDHHASFGAVSPSDLGSLASVVTEVLRKLYHGLNNPDFNYVIATAPVGDENKDYFLWHVRIIPRLTQMAGFELGSGIFINPAVPEETAQFMRDWRAG